MGGVSFIACDLGHHMYVAKYREVWPDAKTIGVRGLAQKRKDVQWDFTYDDWLTSPEEHYGFSQDIESVFFEGFITYAVAWYHKPSKTLIVSDLLMNLPATEQYDPSSAAMGLFSKEFAKRANPSSVWFRRLIYYVASVDYSLMRRDTKRVAQWDINRIVACHGDLIEDGGSEAWATMYAWFLQGSPRPSLLWHIKQPILTVSRWLFLM
jgi:hypothetical protein